MGTETFQHSVYSSVRHMRRGAILACAVAICVSCSSDEDNSDEQTNAGGVAGSGAAPAATGGKATTGGRSGAGGAVGGSNVGVGGAVVGAAGSAVGGASVGGASPSAGAAGAPVTGGGGAGGVAGSAPTSSLQLYVACADSTGSIMHVALEPTSGAVSTLNTYSTGVSNSWATLNAAQTRMYVNSRTQGRITTLSRDPATGALAVLGSVSVPMAPEIGGGTAGAAGAAGVAGAAGAAGTGNTPSGNPSTQTVALDGTEHFLLAANYSANYVYVYPILANGTVGEMVASKTDGVSAHQTVFPPGASNNFVLVPYRGSDTIVTYGFNATTGALNLVRTYQSDADAAAATTGPRHIVFHPTNPTWAYAVNEIAGSVTVLKFDNTTGELTTQQTVSSVPPTYTAQDKFASEIAIAPSGNFVYVSNRYSTAGTFTAEGSLGVFAVNASTGQLTPVDFQSSRGALPRHFALSNDGSVLVVGNQNSSNIAIFDVNKTTGALTHKATRDVCNTPFFVKMIGN